jgi:hypothetical protein
MMLYRFKHTKPQAPAPGASTAHDEGTAWPAPGGVRRLAIAAAALLTFATPALAVTHPWNPATARPNIDQPVAPSAIPVASAARNVLAVLRRPQTQEDRDKAGPLLRAVGMGNQLDGVQTSDIRVLPERWALVPVTTVRMGSESSASGQLCITDGEVIGCSAATGIADHGTAIATADVDGSTYTGLVPDGVSRVRFLPKEGPSVERDVTSNFYTLSVAATEPTQPVQAPPGYTGGRTIPGPTAPLQGSIEWLDATGKVVRASQMR